MAHYEAYIARYGDRDFNEMPFNEVDGLIFSQLAYVDYAGIVGGADAQFQPCWTTRRGSILLCTRQRRSTMRSALCKRRFIFCSCVQTRAATATPGCPLM